MSIGGNARKQADNLATAAAALGSERAVAAAVASVIALAMLAGNDSGNREGSGGGRSGLPATGRMLRAIARTTAKI